MNPADPPGASHDRPAWFWVAVAIVTLWLLGILVAALLTANPTTLNRAQLLSSDAVVVGLVTAVADSGTATIETRETLRGEGIPPQFQLSHAGDLVNPGEEYLFPLQHVGDGFQITPAPARAEKQWLVYPVHEQVLPTAKEILESHPEIPYS